MLFVNALIRVMGATKSSHLLEIIVSHLCRDSKHDFSVQLEVAIVQFYSTASDIHLAKLADLIEK